MPKIADIVERYLFETELQFYSPADREVRSVPFAYVLEGLTNKSFQPDRDQLNALDGVIRYLKLRSSQLLAAQSKV